MDSRPLSTILTCHKCSKQITLGQSSVSNWAVIKNQYTCGECQGLSDFPASIKSWGPGGKVAMEINISAAASTLGRKGGLSKSPAKSAASRENGRLGGRPKKSDARTGREENER